MVMMSVVEARLAIELALNPKIKNQSVDISMQYADFRGEENVDIPRSDPWDCLGMSRPDSPVAVRSSAEAVWSAPSGPRFVPWDSR